MKNITALSVAFSIALSGCATASKDIGATYVSPLQYQNYDCSQLGAETQRIQSRVVELGGRLDQAAANDKAIATGGAILFWPALFALGGMKSQEAEFGRLKGEYEALQRASIERKCSSVVAPTTVPTEQVTQASGQASATNAP